VILTTLGISLGKSVGNKKYYYRGIYRCNEAGNFIFLLPTDLPTDKKLPMKDSLTEHFRRQINYQQKMCLMPTKKFCW
jgi:hypothetical protein